MKWKPKLLTRGLLKNSGSVLGFEGRSEDREMYLYIYKHFSGEMYRGSAYIIEFLDEKTYTLFAASENQKNYLILPYSRCNLLSKG